MPNRPDLAGPHPPPDPTILEAATRVQTDIQALRDQLPLGHSVTDQQLADLQNQVAVIQHAHAAAGPPHP